jgi:glycosyltransferase involved in cell wall biosynthesis
MLSGTEKVTILIPTYNRETLIIETLQCILKQTYPHINILIYNDGSTDRTEEVIRSNGFHGLSIIQGEENQGVAHARNILLSACKTKYACWWDSDDLCNIYRIEKQMEKIREGFDIVFTVFASFRSYEHINYEQGPIQKKRPIAFASMLFKIDTAIQFNEEKRFGGEDAAWSSRMKEGKKVSYIEEVLYYVRYHGRRIGQVRKRLTEEDRAGSYAEAEKRMFGEIL